LEIHELHDSALDQKDKDGNSIKGGRSENSVRIPDEWAHPDQNPTKPWAAENLAWVANMSMRVCK
jgi:hypothetical protein